MSYISSPRKPSRYLGLTALAVGAVFLFDPFIGIFDLLPDAIGYLLFAIGLYRFSDLDERLADASRAAGRLALLGVARLLAILLTFALVSPTERPVFILLVAFSFGVLDCLLFIPLWRNLSGGFLYLGSRVNATAVFDRQRRGGHLHTRSLCERYVGFSTVCFVLREILAILPEMTVLTHEQGGSDWGGNTLYNYVGMFRFVGALLSLILGILWMVKTFGFVRKLKSDKPFFESLHRKYETEVLVRRDLFAMRAIKASLSCLAAAAVLSLDVYIEGVSILPDLLAALCMLLSICFLTRYTAGEGGKHRPAMLVTLLYAVSATVAWLLQFSYLSFNDLPNIEHDPLLRERLSTVTLIQAITAALFLAAYLLILRLLYDLVRRHTGLRALHAGSTYAADRTDAIHTRIRRKLLWVAVFAGLSALSATLLWGVVPHLAPIDLPLRPTTSEALFVMFYDYIREAYWSLDLIIGGGLIALTIHATLEISEQMDYSYLMN